MFEPAEFIPQIQTYEPEGKLGELGVSFEIQSLSEAQLLRVTNSQGDLRLQRAFEFGVTSISGVKFKGKDITKPLVFLAMMESTNGREAASLVMEVAARVLEITIMDEDTAKNS